MERPWCDSSETRYRSRDDARPGMLCNFRHHDGAGCCGRCGFRARRLWPAMAPWARRITACSARGTTWRRSRTRPRCSRDSLRARLPIPSSSPGASRSEAEAILRAVRASRGEALPILALARADWPSDAIDVLGAGASDFAVWPSSEAELYARAGNLARLFALAERERGAPRRRAASRTSSSSRTTSCARRSPRSLDAHAPRRQGARRAERPRLDMIERNARAQAQLIGYADVSRDH